MELRRWVMRRAGEPLVEQPFEPRAPERGEVVVAVSGCGLCHTDLGFLFGGVRTQQSPPLVLGHEISGRVVDAGPDATSWLGQAVIIPAVLPCNECDLCLRGKHTMCRAQRMPGNDFDGGFATHVTVPARDLCRVDERALAAAGLELWQVAVVADAVTTPYQAVSEAGVERGDVVVVIGVGGVGGYCAQIAAARGALVIAVDVDPQKLAAIAKVGAAALTLDARSLDGKAMKKRVAELAAQEGGRPYEWKVFECSGTKAGQETAFSLLTFGSTLSVVGFTLDKVELRLSSLMALSARAVGNWGCAPALYPAALELVLQGKVVIAPFVERHALTTINDVLERAKAHSLLRRAVLTP